MLKDRRTEVQKKTAKLNNKLVKKDGAILKWFIFVEKLAAPLLWRGAVSLLTEGRGRYSFLRHILNIVKNL